MPPTPGPITWDGPLVNQIPQPNRAVDNSTVWQPDYNQQHFQNLYFGGGESLKNYYEAQSSGRYSVEGTVTDWVQVRFNQARYGRSNGFPCATNVCSNTWLLVQDAANQWYADQVAAGRTAGRDQGRARDVRRLGPLRLQRQRRLQRAGRLHRPLPDRARRRRPGRRRPDLRRGRHLEPPLVRVPGRRSAAEARPATCSAATRSAATGLWIGDYTIQPENGGRSVFYHEYGHDLGLPDDYNIHPRRRQQQRALDPDGPEPARRRERRRHRRARRRPRCVEQAPARLARTPRWCSTTRRRTSSSARRSTTRTSPRPLVVELPQKTVTTELGAPASGSNQWWSGDGNNLENTLTRQVTLPAGLSALMTFQARWDIEDCGPDPCDYAFVEVDDGTGFHAIPGSITDRGRRATESTARRRPTARRRSTCRPSRATRSVCGSGTRRIRQPPVTTRTCRTASSSTTSPSPPAGRRSSAMERRPGSAAGPPPGSRSSAPASRRTSTTSTSPVTGRTCPTTST